jgi:serine/threonine protein kinase
MHAHIAVKPTPPSEINPRAPDALSAITMKLLSKNAEDRYHGAEGLKADLEECRRRWESSGQIGPFSPGQYWIWSVAIDDALYVRAYSTTRTEPRSASS